MPQAHVPSCPTWIPPSGSLSCLVATSPGTFHPIALHPGSLSSFPLAPLPAGTLPPGPGPCPTHGPTVPVTLITAHCVPISRESESLHQARRASLPPFQPATVSSWGVWWPRPARGPRGNQPTPINILQTPHRPKCTIILPHPPAHEGCKEGQDRPWRLASTALP